MDEENQINHRDEVLSRFRESLRRPISERYFDEDELIEIFDYAGDVNDEYLRTEALLCAARFFPESQAMLERKAIYYSQYSDELRQRILEDNTTEKGMIWDILRAKKAAGKSPEETAELLDRIVNEYDNFSDEEIIQLIDLASYLGQMQWIKDNIEILRGKVGFINILLYEVAVAASNFGETQLAIEMLEELTEIDPMNPSFWLMLGQEYSNNDEIIKALSAIEYSLAIEPDLPQSLFVKARLLYAQNSSDRNIIPLLEQAVESPRAEVEMVKFLGALYHEKNLDNKAEKVLRQYMERYPAEAIMIIPDLIIFKPDDINELLDQLYSLSENNSQILWISWSHQLDANGYAEQARLVLEAYQRNSGEKILSLMPIEKYFINGDFDLALHALGDYLDNNESVEMEFPTMAIIHLVSMLRVGAFEKALAFCDFLISSTAIDSCRSIGKRIEFIGLMNIVNDVQQRLHKGESLEFWQTYDPLGLWK